MEIFDPDGGVIGGIGGAICGVERFTHGVDLAVALDSELVAERLQQAGMAARVLRSRCCRQARSGLIVPRWS